MFKVASRSLAVRGEQRLSRLRRIWIAYQHQPVLVRIFTPVLSFAVAYGALQWSWSVLAQDEYGVALLLTLVFVLVGIGAVLLIPKKLIKIPCVISILIVGVYSASVIRSAKGDKPWTTLRLTSTRTTATPSPSPIKAVNREKSLQQLRSELQADALKALRDVGFKLKLNRSYSIDELGHFRIVVEVFSNSPRRTLDFFLACRDHYDTNEYVRDDSKQYGYRCTAAYRPTRALKYAPMPVYATSPRKYSGYIMASRETDELEWTIDLYNQMSEYKTLEDLNTKDLYVFITANLVDKVSELRFWVNNWEFVSVKPESLRFVVDKPIAPWLLPLSQTEAVSEWRGVYLKESESITNQFGETGMVFSLDSRIVQPKRRVVENVVEPYSSTQPSP